MQKSSIGIFAALLLAATGTASASASTPEPGSLKERLGLAQNVVRGFDNALSSQEDELEKLTPEEQVAWWRNWSNWNNWRNWNNWNNWSKWTKWTKWTNYSYRR